MMIFFIIIVFFQIFFAAFTILLLWGCFQRLLIYQQRWRNTLFFTGYPILIIVLLLTSILSWIIPPLGNFLSMPVVSSLHNALIIGLILITYFENVANKSYFPILFIFFVFVLLNFLGMIVIIFYFFISVSAFFSWRAVVQNGRYYSALPVTNKIATTAQGNTVITGQAITQENLLRSESGLRAIWYYSYHLSPRLELGESLRFKTLRKEEGIPFFIDDGSGKCHISPENSRFYLSNDFLKIKGFFLIRGEYEASLALGQTVYAYGDFRTTNTGSALSLKNETKKVLMQWQDTPNYLNERFDLDNDGKLNEQEFQLAYSSARRAANTMLEKKLTQTFVEHHMTRDSNKKFCIITDLSPKAIAARCQKVAWYYLIIFFLTLPKVFYTLFLLRLVLKSK